MNRTDADSLHGFATVNGTKGVILLPDDWTTPSGITFNVGTAAYTNNVFTTAQWYRMDSAGAVFLPAAGYRSVSDKTIYDVQTRGRYWSSTVNTSVASGPLFAANKFSVSWFYCFDGMSVRLAREL